MRLPVLAGVIRRRLLVNFRVAPEVMQAQLPPRFRPKLQDGHAIAGICLIRLEAVRPRALPAFVGLASENAAHRVAVVWEGENGEEREGVYIPRRDTGSAVNRLAGGRIFPGEHEGARFAVRESDEAVDLGMESNDGVVKVRVQGRFGGGLPPSSCFPSLADASRFFERGCVGYSATRDPRRLDGLELRTQAWAMEPLQVEQVFSSYFTDPARFPPGAVTFDCALAMRGLPHEWHRADDLYL